jgi:enhancing lycopene biosynthesis protein 2
MGSKLPKNTKKIKINGQEITVDSELAQLIKALNKVGIKTIYSCWGHNSLKEAYLMIDMANIDVRIDTSFVRPNHEQITTLALYWKK